MKIILKIFGHRIGSMGHIESDKPNPVYMVGPYVHSRVGVIRVKWGRGEIWIHIMIETIIVVKIHFIVYKKENEQTNKDKEKENMPILGLT